MEQHSKLTGIERELVLQYLIDGNVPVTLTPIEEPVSEENDSEIEKSKPCYLCSHDNSKDNTCIYCDTEHRCWSKKT